MSAIAGFWITGYNVAFREDVQVVGTEQETVVFTSQPPQHFYRALVQGDLAGPTAAAMRAGLSLLSIPYRCGVTIRNWMFECGLKPTYRASVPVVSIGNLTLGGTGKTPAVEYVTRFYRARGRRAGILSRGYGGTSGHNDEAILLREGLPDVPHLQQADRVALARAAVEEQGCEVLILDDGFQHRRLHRDLDIALVDATEPLAKSRLFPRGLLREPLKCLGRAGLVILTRCDQASRGALRQIRDDVATWAPGIAVVESTHAPVRLINATQEAPLSLLEGAHVAAFCGIGNPAAFHRTLLGLGCNIAAFEVFRDHCPYTGRQAERLEAWVDRLPSTDMVVTTQKDLVKLRRPTLGGRPLWAVQIAFQPTAGKDVLDHQLEGVLR